MKSENQIIVRCKQPIKIEKLLQCLFMFSYTMLVKEVFFRHFFFFSFCFLNGLHSDDNSNRVMLLGINIFWALFYALAWAKMTWSQAQNIFVSMNINSIGLPFFSSLTGCFWCRGWGWYHKFTHSASKIPWLEG